ncbi:MULTISPECIES: RidA family protein [unclassified Microbacterium]|uniref:RidA family protein n=1 Tax=unclassified Microbacterium TaxID=2609290 RepID=UPI0012F85433|nr:RidA family protein [Microbacterium sp. MAH-37]
MQVRVDAGRTPVEGGIRAQADAVFDRIADVLAAEGATVADIVKVTYFLVDIADLEVVRQVVRERLPDPKPASSLVQVAALVDSRFRLEIEAIATAPQR